MTTQNHINRKRHLEEIENNKPRYQNNKIRNSLGTMISILGQAE